MTTSPNVETPPGGDLLTDYDLAHLDAYLRLLDIHEAGDEGWRDVVACLFGGEAAGDPARARRIYNAHLDRARWMTQVGYRQLAACDPRRVDGLDENEKPSARR